MQQVRLGCCMGACMVHSQRPALLKTLEPFLSEYAELRPTCRHTCSVSKANRDLPRIHSAALLSWFEQFY